MINWLQVILNVEFGSKAYLTRGLANTDEPRRMRLLLVLDMAQSQPRQGIRTREPAGSKRNTSRPGAPGTGYLPPQKNKKMERNESSRRYKNRIRQSSGISRSEPTPIRTIQNGSITSSPDGPRKCRTHQKAVRSFTVFGEGKMACVRPARNPSQRAPPGMFVIL